MRSQHSGVHRRRHNRRHVGGNAILSRGFRVIETPNDVVGHQTLEELEGFGSFKPDYGPGFEKTRHGAGGLESRGRGEEFGEVARIGFEELEMELEALHLGVSCRIQGWGIGGDGGGAGETAGERGVYGVMCLCMGRKNGERTRVAVRCRAAVR